MKFNDLIRTVSVLAAGCVLLGTARAQHGGTGWDGGSGTWDATSGHWDGGNAYFNSNDRTTDAKPVFYSGGGTVTVDDSKSSLPITFGEMDFYNAGDWTLKGDALDNVEADYSATVVYVDGGAGNVTIQNTINVAPNPTNGGSYFVNSAANKTLTLGNLNISSIPQSGKYGNGGTYTNQSSPLTYYRSDNSSYSVNSQSLIFLAANGSSIVLNGKVTSDPGVYGGGFLFGSTGVDSTATYVVNGGFENARNGNKQFDIGSGTVVLNTADTGTGDFAWVGHGNAASGAAYMSVLTDTAGLTIGNGMYAQTIAANSRVGSEIAGNTTFTGLIKTGDNQGSLDMYAVSGATVTFKGDIGGTAASTSKSGDGTVILANATGNDYGTSTSQAFTANAGTTIIKNTSGSAFGSTTSGVQANIAGGATLGGSGISTQQVVALANNSVIAPGVQAGGVATELHLNGGLATTGLNGLTMNFNLNGYTNDSIDLGGSVMTLNGPIVINLTGTPTIDNSNYGVFYLLTGIGAGSTTNGLDVNALSQATDFDPAFVVTPPAGYVVVSSGFTPGADATLNTYFVELAAVPTVPEPSTYALMLGGLVVMGFLARRRLA